MRILVTGQPGTRKATFARKLVEYVLTRRGIDPAGPLTVSGREINWYELEAPDFLDSDLKVFLTNYNETQQQSTLSKSLHRIAEELQRNEPRDALLLMHATYYRQGRFVSPVNWDDLLKCFKPDFVITLIDDIYDIWERIEQGPLDTHLSLEEILNWRSSELLSSHLIAENLRIDHQKFGFQKVPKKIPFAFGGRIPYYLMAVKHPVETFYHLIFENPRTIYYASHPITRTREHAEGRKEINDFINALRETQLTIIEPLTIDELRMDPTDPRWYTLARDRQYQEYQTKRWSLSSPTIPPPVRYTRNPFSGMHNDRISKLTQSIYQHVVARDFRMVGQSDELVVYRPFYPKRTRGKRAPASETNPAGGVYEEVNYALLSYARTTHVFHPKCDRNPKQMESNFRGEGVWARVVLYPSRDKLRGLNRNDPTAGFSELIKALIARGTHHPSRQS